MSQFYSTRFGGGDPRTFTGLNPTFLTFANMVTGTTNTPPIITEVVAGSGLYGWTYGVTQSIAFLIDAATTSPGSQARYVTGQMDPSDRANAYGDSLMAFGSSLFALGTSNIALGTTNVALGTTNVALGTTGVAIGTTLIGFGMSSYPLGLTTNVLSIATYSLAININNQINPMSITLAAIGTTSAALGSTLSSIALFMGDTTASIGSTSVDPSSLFGFLKRAQEIAEGAQIYTKATGVWQLLDRTNTTLLRQKTVADNSTQTSRT